MMKRKGILLFLLLFSGVTACKNTHKEPEGYAQALTVYLECKEQADVNCLFQLTSPDVQGILKKTSSRIRKLKSKLEHAKKKTKSCVFKKSRLAPAVLEMTTPQDLLLFSMKKPQKPLSGLVQRVKNRIRRVSKTQGDMRLVSLMNGAVYKVGRTPDGRFYVVPEAGLKKRIVKLAARVALALTLTEDSRGCSASSH